MRIFVLALLAIKQAWRHPIRSGLTVMGVATGMFLFTTIESIQQVVSKETTRSAADDTLVVYRENRFCPFTSRLPERYSQEIAQLDGVADVVPIKVVVNNCRTSLDVVTLRGIPHQSFDSFLSGKLDIIDGSERDWFQRDDAALVGDVLARRRALQVGDRFDAAGVTVTIVGIVKATRAQDRNTAYVHLPFLQQVARGGLGEVTQFTVRVSDPQQMDSVAKEIDALFADDTDPTHTRPQQAFMAEVARGMLELVAFTRWVGWGAVLAVIALIANTVMLAVRSRVREIAILGTLGFQDTAIAWLVVVEGMFLGAIGGLVGGIGSVVLLHFGAYSLSSEGLSIVVVGDWRIVVIAAVISALLGLLAGLAPAWRAARQPIVSSLRMV